ncbi:MAG: SMI1/KNR4 family protein [Lachnospiraceae bacterium]|nr:SMI1/KNR4 family protein [Lachnospiraceae bacterium]MDD7026581.1 SMI1/KNR4 family protein [Lachnospiraceae bacterium]MDY5701582.1 SMI1/KNR4 family protein [Lachnospiraceae bacterium]
MNILKELAGKINGQIVLRTALDEENCSFLWNEPATIEEIEAFEKKHQCSFPEAYKEFLLISNGATLFKTESGSNGYQLLSLKEMEEETQEIREDGYIISDKCYCFIKFLFNGDVLFLDLDKKFNYILDGNMRRHSYKWEYINSDINTFFEHLCQCNGATYWRWQ